MHSQRRRGGRGRGGEPARGGERAVRGERPLAARGRARIFFGVSVFAHGGGAAAGRAKICEQPLAGGRGAASPPAEDS